jgi:hypothetical protein
VTDADFPGLVQTGVIRSETFLWCEGMAEWKSYGELSSTPQQAGQSLTSEPLVAAVLMAGDEFPFAGVEKQVRNLRLGGQQPTNLELKDGMLSFQAGGEFIVMTFVLAPYPWSDLEGYCQTSWTWPPHTPAMSLQQHRTHLLVTLTLGTSDPVTRRLMLTQLTALAAQQPGAMGVCWPEAGMVHYPPLFVKMAESFTTSDAPPVYLWVDFRLFPNEDGVSGGMFAKTGPHGDRGAEGQNGPGRLARTGLQYRSVPVEQRADPEGWRDAWPDGEPENPYPPPSLAVRARGNGDAAGDMRAIIYESLGASLRIWDAACYLAEFPLGSICEKAKRPAL